MGEYGLIVMWIVLAVVFVVAEAMTTQLVGVWFAIGALVGLVFELIDVSFGLQFLAFAVTSAVLLAITKPIVRKYINVRAVATNADRAIGETALVVAEIAGGFAGQVKINGLTWSAVSAFDGVIPIGNRVTVCAIEGVKLVVEPITEILEV